MTEPQSGMMITPSIRLDRLLGQGGMGSVWVADHLKFYIKVVVKFMAPEFTSNAEAMQRFEREAALAAQAKSPHVVQIYDHGISDIGLPYIAMELLEGEDLATRMEREGPIAPEMYAGWLWQACSGLSKAHARGIVHRDVKPENIFLCDEDGEMLVKVLDFGIAKSHQNTDGFSGTRTGVMMGTAYYMSPEQTMGAKNIDARTDVWAVGAMTYFALTGIRPFDADSIGALVYAITAGPIPTPSSHNPSLPPAVDAWMEKALARDINQRFASAKELAEAFVEAVSGAETGRASVLGGIHAVRARTGSAPDHTVPGFGAPGTAIGPGSPAEGTIANFGQTAPGVPTKSNSKLVLFGGLGVAAAAIIGIFFGLSSGDDVEAEVAADALTPVQEEPLEQDPVIESEPAVERAPEPVEEKPQTKEAEAEEQKEDETEPEPETEPETEPAPVKAAAPAPAPRPVSRSAPRPAPAPKSKPKSAFGGRL